jgi:hypothetical protein
VPFYFINLLPTSLLYISILLCRKEEVVGRDVEFVAQGHINDDVPYSCQPEILDHEVCLFQSAAVWHVLAICS